MKGASAPFPRQAYAAWLRSQGLAESTATIYARFAARCHKAGVEPAVYVRRNWKRWAAGTRVWILGAAQHYERWLEVQGTPVQLRVREQDRPKQKPVAGFTREPLTKDQLDAFLAAVDKQEEPYRTLLALLPRTGLRVSEITHLRWSDRTESPPGLNVVGKGNKKRWVPLGKAARKLLAAYRKTLAEVKPEGFVFPSPQAPGEALHPETVRHRLKQVRRLLGPWAASLSPHVLRHTFASLFLEQHGYDHLPALQDLLGHASAGMTRRYAKPAKAQLAALLENE